jgi:hypothetical protein|tara:strand:- start:55 stop:312 length:258 start_codon:yes stop_codon:yes gene_type:complete
MAYPDIEHFDRIKSQIVSGIRKEMREEILESYSISDQLNATGSDATAMKAAISTILATGQAKQAAVAATTDFEELNEVVPMADPS